MPLALSEPEILKIASAIVGALALAVTTLFWRSERAHERRHAWTVRLIQDLLALLERRRVTDAEIAAALRGLAREPADPEKPEKKEEPR
jgi:hypothetical protein